MLRTRTAQQRRNASSAKRNNRSHRRMAVEPLEDRRLLAVFTVTNLNDTGGGSLRGAIAAANANGEPDLINFQPGLTGTIELSSGYLQITDDLTISGPGASHLTVDANRTSAVFYIFDDDDTQHVDVTLDGLTITGGVPNSFASGGIYSSENLTLANSVVSGNEGFVGGVAVVALSGSTTTISNSMISGNYGFYGGGVAAFPSGGNISIYSSSITDNTAVAGGGVFASGPDGNLSISNVTISGNTASYGGGVFAQDVHATIAHATITGNTAVSTTGGGILLNTYANLTLDHSIVAANESYVVTASDIDQRGTLTATFSLIGDNSGTFLAEANPDVNGNIIGGPVGGLIDPRLGPLSSNGGGTLSHALRPASPALDAGDPNFISPPEFDQRGNPFSRVTGSHIDIGSIEASPITLVVDNLTDESDGDFSSGDLSLREAIEAANGNAAADTITFDPSLAGQTTLLAMGELAITDSVEIVGPAGSSVIIRSLNSSSRIFHIDDGDNGSLSNVTISNLQLSDALTPTFDSGGAIVARENLTISHSVISGNTAPSAGGAIRQFAGSLTIENSLIENNAANFYSGGAIAFTGKNLVIRNSTIANNTANATASSSVGGGGIFFRSTGSLLVENSVVTGNTSQADGGGIYARDAGSVYILGSAINRNLTTAANGDGAGVFVRDSVTKIADSSVTANSVTDDGGGVYVFSGNAVIFNSTISGNLAGDDGAGVMGVSGGAITLSHSTVTGNLADADGSGDGSGGGGRTTGTITLDHTIVATNLDAGSNPDLDGNVDMRFSLLGDNSGSNITNNGGNLIGTAAAPIDPRLGPLVVTTGITATHGLLPFSPAINAGDPAFVGPPDFDQRGAPFARIAGGRVDMGALESQPLNLVVDTLLDEDDGDTSTGDLSLREAIAIAASPDADTITFAPGLGGQTITLTLGQLDIRGPVTIEAPFGGLTIDAGGDSRIFNVDDQVTGNHIAVTLDGLTLSGGNVVGAGGAIRSLENLTLANSLVTNNTATGPGGGIYAHNTDLDATTYIVDTTISENRTTGNVGAGGGLYFRSAGLFASISGTTFSGNRTSGLAADGAGLAIQANGTTVVVSESTITGNTASGSDGGGVYFNASNFGAVLIQQSTISGNQAVGALGVGGGVFAVTSNYGLGFVDSSTVSGNRANSHGGGIALAYGSEVSLFHATVTENTSDNNNDGTGQGGGLFLDLNASLGLDHTIVAANTDRTGTAPDIRRILGSLTPGFSLIGDNTGSGLAEANPDGNGNIIGGPLGGVIDPLLGPLADHGGSTLTHDLLVGSPAINAGNAVISNPPAFDQRAAPFARIADGRIDIGSFEVQTIDVTAMVVDTAADESDGDFSVGDLSLREAIELANAATGLSTISFDANLSGSTITLTMGQLEITDSVDLLGLGAGALTVDASGNDPTPNTDQGDGTRVLLVDDGDNASTVDVTIQGLTLTGGDEIEYGGGIYSYENLTLRNTVITGNAASGRGGLSLQIPAGGAGAVSNVVVSDNRAIAHGVTYIDGAIGGALLVARDGATLTVDNLAVDNNFADHFDGGLEVFSQGGTVSVEDTAITGNTSLQNRGGGSFFSSQDGQLTVTRTNISGNSAAGYAGGAALVTLQGHLSVSDSTVTENAASDNGGGLYVTSNQLGSITISGSTIANNIAANAGGIAFDTLEQGAVPLVENTTISGNVVSGRGGGVSGYAEGAQTMIATLRHTTVTANAAAAGGGGLNNANGSAMFGLDHVLAAGNRVASGLAPDLTGGFLVRHSLIGDNTGSGLAEAPVGAPDANGNLVGGPTGGVIDPLLGPLAVNGGTTQTHALLAGSPAVNAGDANAVAGVGNVPEFDQRGSGFDRVQQGRIDIGAFESDLLPPTIDGDFNDDGVYDCLDIDALVAQIAAGTHGAGFDLSGDGLVDLVDRDLWLTEAGAANLGPGKVYLLGDATLDGIVDGLDFIQWNNRKFTAGNGWCGGDFNADGITDGLDFIAWNNNKFQSSDAIGLATGPAEDVRVPDPVHASTVWHGDSLETSVGIERKAWQSSVGQVYGGSDRDAIRLTADRREHSRWPSLAVLDEWFAVSLDHLW